ncbi:uncharacterized protein N0V89_000275 [Didymosphaeria variabile]|uniref:Xylanolytic transcriptional activator regulatory domain-containing protein n=1 Tax=Didymosphaeria variabile TaxID=1932322 RepID=A0A9W9CFJ3_9PLEO|nr:uncharacterized protein N0V89_000275 [Didymosphaeria variabile]KAJ4359719.1 hypothetical protein N0V89_000275 [Didymosphaeria variabile]
MPSEEPHPQPRVTPVSAFNIDTGPSYNAVASSTTPHTSDPTAVFSNPTNLFTTPQPTPQPAPTNPPLSTQCDDNIHLLCTVDASRVRDRWLEGWVPRPNQQSKDLPRGTAVFIHSILKAYPQSLCKGDLPPIIHDLQLVDGKLPSALANCVSIARMWEGQREGGGALVKDTSLREMERLFAEKEKYGQWELLAAFQAYIMYVTLLLDPAGEPVVPQDVMLNLQDFAHTIAVTGLVDPSDHPSWAAWALAEAKRRALFAMYMLDDIVNFFSHVPCIMGDELADLPAPCSEKLWRTDEEGKWRRLYGESFLYTALLLSWRRFLFFVVETWAKYYIPTYETDTDLGARCACCGVGGRRAEAERALAEDGGERWSESSEMGGRDGCVGDDDICSYNGDAVSVMSEF